jgi:uncharacterized protein YcfL
MGKRTGLIIVICLFGLVLNTGCAKRVSQPVPGLPPGSNMEVKPTPAIDTSYGPLTRVIASDYLIGYIAVVNPRIGQTGAFTKAQVTVQNLTQNRYSLEYQFQWQDAQQFQVGDPRPWKRFVLGPKEAKIIKEMALNKDAVRTIFTVRLPDDTFIELNKQIQKRLQEQQ